VFNTECNVVNLLFDLRYSIRIGGIVFEMEFYIDYLGTEYSEVNKHIVVTSSIRNSKFILEMELDV